MRTCVKWFTNVTYVWDVIKGCHRSLRIVKTPTKAPLRGASKNRKLEDGGPGNGLLEEGVCMCGEGGGGAGDIVCVGSELRENHSQMLGLVCRMRKRNSQSKLSTLT